MRTIFLLISLTFTSHSIFPQEKSLSELISLIDHCVIHESLKQPIKNYISFLHERQDKGPSTDHSVDTSSAIDTTSVEAPIVDSTLTEAGFTPAELSRLKDFKNQFISALSIIQKSNTSDKWKSVVTAYQLMALISIKLEQPKMAVESYNTALKNFKENQLDFCGITIWTKSEVYNSLTNLYLELKNFQAVKQSLVNFEKSLSEVTTDSKLSIVFTLKSIAIESNNSATLVEAAKRLKEISGLNARHILKLQYLSFLWDSKTKLTDQAINELIIAIELAAGKIYDGFTSKYGENEESLQYLKLNCYSRLIKYYYTQKDYANAHVYATRAFSIMPCMDYKNVVKTFSLLSSLKREGWLPCGGEVFVMTAGQEVKWYFFQPGKLIKSGNFIEVWEKSVILDFEVRDWLYSSSKSDNSVNPNESLDTKSLSSTVSRVSYQKYPQGIKTLSYYKYDSNGNVEDSYKADKSAQYNEVVPGSIGEALWKFYYGVK